MEDVLLWALAPVRVTDLSVFQSSYVFYSLVLLLLWAVTAAMFSMPLSTP